MRHGAWAVGLVFALALSGCSQVAAVAPVGGNHQAEVRYAAIDVLLGAEVEVLVAPVCESGAGGSITCEGQTVAGETISVHSPADDQTTVEVTVGSTVIYSGSIMDVLDESARSGS